MDTKYRTVYKSASRRKLAQIVTEELIDAGIDPHNLRGDERSAAIHTYNEYFALSRSEFTRLLRFRRLSNSQVWVCFIDRHQDLKIGKFIKVEDIWSISYGVDPRPAGNVRSYTARDPIEIPTGRRSLTRKVNLKTDATLSNIFERGEWEMHWHRERIKRHKST